jgi:hypothetical protein
MSTVNFLLILLYEQALGVKVSVPSVFFFKFTSGGDGEFFPHVMLFRGVSRLGRTEP